MTLRKVQKFGVPKPQPGDSTRLRRDVAGGKRGRAVADTTANPALRMAGSDAMVRGEQARVLQPNARSAGTNNAGTDPGGRPIGTMGKFAFDDDGGNAPRTLGPLEVDDLFVSGRQFGRVRISDSCPIVGELVRDASGGWYLAPEEDMQGGDTAAIRLHGVAELDRSPPGQGLVKVSGIYEDGIGITVARIAADEE
jgi:hypothetical protein